MPSQLHIVKARDFVRFSAQGVIDFDHIAKVLSEIAAALHLRGVDRAVIDLRGSESALNITDIYKLAIAFRDAGPHEGDRLAILVRHTRLDRADFFASLATHQGLVVGAFDNYEEAIDWLFASEVYNPSRPASVEAQSPRSYPPGA